MSKKDVDKERAGVMNTEVIILLKAIEWSADFGRKCPICGWRETNKHHDDCNLAKAIALLESQTEAAILEIKSIASKFKILDGWEFGFEPNTKYKGQCTVVMENQHCLIYGWPQNGPIPDDYYLHEVLHAALGAFRASEKREDEEQFTQDLCALIKDKGETNDQKRDQNKAAAGRVHEFSNGAMGDS